MDFICSFKYRVFNACGWSVQPKHVAYSDENNNICCTDYSTYVTFTTMEQNGANFVKISRYSEWAKGMDIWKTSFDFRKV